MQTPPSASRAGELRNTVIAGSSATKRSRGARAFVRNGIPFDYSVRAEPVEERTGAQDFGFGTLRLSMKRRHPGPRAAEAPDE
jgi:hypothetical protein